MKNKTFNYSEILNRPIKQETNKDGIDEATKEKGKKQNRKRTTDEDVIHNHSNNINNNAIINASKVKCITTPINRTIINDMSQFSILAEYGFSKRIKQDNSVILSVNEVQDGNYRASKNQVLMYRGSINVEQQTPNETSSISSISGHTLISGNTGNTTNAMSTIQCNVKFQQVKQSQQDEQKDNRRKIDCFVKGQLFKNLKFVSGHLMQFSMKQSVCQIVCQGLHINPDKRQMFWSLYNRCVEKSINSARNDAVAAVKKSFFKGQ